MCTKHTLREQNAQHIIKKSELKTTLDLPLFILNIYN
jgi:hypothetical protein